jgi:hypothetical protein
MNDQHITSSLDKIRTFFDKASSRIEALKPGEKVPATVLADEIAKEHGMTGPQLYPVLKFLFDGYPGVEIRRGAHGGIIKLAPAVAAPSVVEPTVSEDVTCDEVVEKEPAPIINT